MLKRFTRPEPAPPWGFYAALGAVIAMIAAVIIGTTIAQSFFEISPTSLMTGWSIGMVLTILFVAVTRRRSPEEDEALRLGAPQTPLILILLGMFGVAIGLDLLSWIIVGDATLASAELLNYRDQSVGVFGWVIALLFLVLLQPIGEELVFRGMLFPTLRTNFGPWPGLLLCAAFHAVFHFLVYAPGGTNQTVIIWYGALLPFLDAMVFSMVRAATRSTTAAMVAHAAFGLFAVLKIIAIG